MSEIKFHVLEAENDRVVLKLEENAKVGDTIVLSSRCKAFDNANQWGKKAVDDAVKHAKEQWINGEKQILLLENELAMTAREKTMKEAFDKEIGKLNTAKHHAELDTATAVSVYKEGPEFKKLNTDSISLKATLDVLKKDQKSRINSEAEQLKLTWINENKASWLASHKTTWSKEMDEKNKPLIEKLKTLEDMNNNLKIDIQKYTRWHTGQSKNMGEKLEKICKSDLDNYFSSSAFESVKISMTPFSTGEERADLLVQFCFDNNWLQPFKTIMIECKTKQTELKKDQEEDTTKNKNSTHIGKLIADAKGYKADLAILSTQLEPEDDLTIREYKDLDHPNMDVIICRPFFLVSVVKIYFSYYKKLWDHQTSMNGDILQKDVAIDFSQQFQELKDDIFADIKLLQNSFTRITQYQNYIIKHAQDTQSLIANTITDSIKGMKQLFNKSNPEHLTSKSQELHPISNHLIPKPNETGEYS